MEAMACAQGQHRETVFNGTLNLSPARGSIIRIIIILNLKSLSR